MAVRVYVVPMRLVLTARGPVRGPRYVALMSVDPEDVALAGLAWGAIPYGDDDAAILVADVTTAQHNALAGKADVLALPADLDANLTAGAVTTAQALLESLKIPAGWVSTAFTYRQVVRIVGGMFQYAQAVAGRLGQPVVGVRSLDATYASLPAGVRDAMLEAAQQLSMDTSNLSGASTLRQILREFGGQWGARELVVGGVAL